jgi:hypothetical protein
MELISVTGIPFEPVSSVLSLKRQLAIVSPSKRHFLDNSLSYQMVTPPAKSGPVAVRAA